MSALTDARSLLTKKAVNLVMEQVKVLVDNHQVDIVTDTGIHCMDRNGVEHTYDVVNGDCRCLFYKTYELPCWHLLLFKLRHGLKIFDVVPYRWTNESMNSYATVLHDASIIFPCLGDLINDSYSQHIIMSPSYKYTKSEL